MAAPPGAQQQTHYELYRKSTIGSCLTDAIGMFVWVLWVRVACCVVVNILYKDEMISSNTINPQLGLKLLLQFDKSVNETLALKIKSKITFKVCSHLVLYS